MDTLAQVQQVIAEGITKRYRTATRMVVARINLTEFVTIVGLEIIPNGPNPSATEFKKWVQGELKDVAGTKFVVAADVLPDLMFEQVALKWGLTRDVSVEIQNATTHESTLVKYDRFRPARMG